MSSYIDGRMRHGVDLAEDDELLNGSGVTPNLKGLLHLTTPAVPIARVAEMNADVILKQIAAIENATILDVNGIVMNPVQWLTILLTKDSTGNSIGVEVERADLPAAVGKKAIDPDSAEFDLIEVARLFALPIDFRAGRKEQRRLRLRQRKRGWVSTARFNGANFLRSSGSGIGDHGCFLIKSDATAIARIEGFRNSVMSLRGTT